MKNICIDLLNRRGVHIDDIVEIAYDLQKPYIKSLKKSDVKEVLLEILNKREVYNAVVTGIGIDIAVDEGKFFDETISDIIKGDYGLYGIDEVLAYGICNVYGSIALTNFGYVDKIKPGIIGKVNDDPNQCNTFLDDILGALAASTASKIAHTHKHQLKEEVYKQRKERNLERKEK